ncbi:MAG: hypothetical protein GXY47_14745 [Acidobacteria bacterium]|nr:hypothetical protein [Acidobacteriota bacterium]
MIRRTLFFAITLILVAVLAGLVFRGCQREKERTDGMAELTRESPPSPVRVFAPGDLEVVRSDFALKAAPGGAAAASHDVEIRNHGTLPYQGFRLEFVYLDARGDTLARETCTQERSLPPGDVLVISGIELAPVPASAVRVEASVLSADLAPPSPPQAGRAP